MSVSRQPSSRTKMSDSYLPAGGTSSPSVASPPALHLTLRRATMPKSASTSDASGSVMLDKPEGPKASDQAKDSSEVTKDVGAQVQMDPKACEEMEVIDIKKYEIAHLVQTKDDFSKIENFLVWLLDPTGPHDNDQDGASILSRLYSRTSSQEVEERRRACPDGESDEWEPPFEINRDVLKLHFTTLPTVVCLTDGYLLSDDVYDSDDDGSLVASLVLGDGSRLIKKLRWIDRDTDLADEAKVLTDLQDVKGVPNFFGLFWHGYERSMACLLLEGRGQAIKSFKVLNREQRIELLEILKEVHQHGYKHNDFSPKHVVVDSHGAVSLVGFRKARQHLCRGIKRCDELKVAVKRLWLKDLRAT